MSIENVFTTALFIPISILGFFWYKYYHYILIEEKLKTLWLKDFNEKHRKNLFWASIIAFLLGAIFLEEPKWFSLEKDNLKFTKLFFPYILYLLLYCSLLFLTLWNNLKSFHSKQNLYLLKQLHWLIVAPTYFSNECVIGCQRCRFQ